VYKFISISLNNFSELFLYGRGTVDRSLTTCLSHFLLMFRRVSVTHVQCKQPVHTCSLLHDELDGRLLTMATRRIMQATPHDSLGNLVF